MWIFEKYTFLSNQIYDFGQADGESPIDWGTEGISWDQNIIRTWFFMVWVNLQPAGKVATT